MTPAQKAAATRSARRAAATSMASDSAAASTSTVEGVESTSYVVGPIALPAAREDRPHLPTASAVWQYVLPMMGTAKREIFRVLCVDARFRLLADVVVTVGSTDACHVDPREVFGPAIAARASAIILCHNHPSGDPEPSTQDIQLTDQLRRGGELLCIRVTEHVVVSEKRYVSMAGRCLMMGGAR